MLDVYIHGSYGKEMMKTLWLACCDILSPSLLVVAFSAVRRGWAVTRHGMDQYPTALLVSTLKMYCSRGLATMMNCFSFVGSDHILVKSFQHPNRSWLGLCGNLELPQVCSPFGVSYMLSRGMHNVDFVLYYLRCHLDLICSPSASVHGRP